MSRLVERFVAVLRGRFGTFGTFELVEQASEPWASVTFTGARLRLVLIADPAMATRLMDQVADVDLPVPGHLVADVAAIAEPVASRVRLTLEVLLIENA